MTNTIKLKKAADFFITKIVIGLAVVVGLIVLIESGRQLLTGEAAQNIELQNIVVGIIEILVALASYILLYRFYEKRQIKELRISTFWKNTLLGILTGLILQSLVVLIMNLGGAYSITYINPISFLIPGFTAALVAGFVGEIILRGIIFRLTEEKLGTVIAVIISMLIFAVAHFGVKGATPMSVVSTSIQAGILYSSVYVFSRSLWLPIFLHFSWDLAQPGIFGAINPGLHIEKSLFTSRVTGAQLLTGGQFGPGNSIQSTILCLITGLIFLWMAKRKSNFIKPYWKK
jgi:membrane protease YdiL (CAAX protease family)